MNGKYANASEITRKNRMEMKVIRSVITMAMKPEIPVFIIRFPSNVYSFRLRGYPRKHKGALIAKCVRNGKSIVVSAGAIGYDGKYIRMIFGYFRGFSCFKIKSALCFYGKEQKLVEMLGKERKSPDETRGKTERREIKMNVVIV